MRFGLKDVGELPSMEEFEKLVAESFQSDLLPAASESSDAMSSLESSAVEFQNSEPGQTSDDSELATAKHRASESDPAA
jgi:segregation and condensation protein B